MNSFSVLSCATNSWFYLFYFVFFHFPHIVLLVNHFCKWSFKCIRPLWVGQIHTSKGTFDILSRPEYSRLVILTIQVMVRQPLPEVYWLADIILDIWACLNWDLMIQLAKGSSTAWLKYMICYNNNNNNNFKVFNYLYPFFSSI